MFVSLCCDHLFEAAQVLSQRRCPVPSRRPKGMGGGTVTHRFGVEGQVLELFPETSTTVVTPMYVCGALQKPRGAHAAQLVCDVGSPGRSSKHDSDSWVLSRALGHQKFRRHQVCVRSSWLPLRSRCVHTTLAGGRCACWLRIAFPPAAHIVAPTAAGSNLETCRLADSWSST